MKGTGRWTIQEAAERSTAAPTMAAALDARYLSGRKAERVEAAKILKGPEGIPKVAKEQLVEDMKAALYCSKICSYAQVRMVATSTSPLQLLQLCCDSTQDRNGPPSLVGGCETLRCPTPKCTIILHLASCTALS